jgi:pectinesterase
VVAKDGSGHYKTVQAALDAASKRKFKTRFVIHVKKGVYKENIEVAVHNDNIMLVGEGMQNTIITSSRSVQGGFTTYSSATAGELFSIFFIFFMFFYLKNCNNSNEKVELLKKF